MRSPSRLLTAALTAGLLVLPACSNGDSTADPTPTPQTTTSSEPPATPTPTSTPTTDQVDLTSVPDEITVEYLQALMDEFNRLEADVYRAFKEVGDPNDVEVVERYASILDSATAQAELSYIAEEEGMDALGSPPRPPESEVLDILDRTDECVLFTVRHDHSPLFAPDVAPDLPQPWYFAIAPTSGPNAYNPTTWVQELGASIAKEEGPPRTCAEVEDFR